MPARNPRGWGEYISAVGTPSPEAAVFYGRFRMAAAFDGAAFPGLAERTASAYSAVLECVLVYSAWESVVKATGTAPTIVSDPLAERIRGTRGFLDYLASNTDTHVSKEIERFRESKTQNIRYVMAAIRHLHAHGAWTPSGSGLKTKRSISVVNDIGRVSLVAIDESFTNWVRSGKTSGRAQ